MAFIFWCILVEIWNRPRREVWSGAVWVCSHRPAIFLDAFWVIWRVCFGPFPVPVFGYFLHHFWVIFVTILEYFLDRVLHFGAASLVVEKEEPSILFWEFLVVFFGAFFESLWAFFGRRFCHFR